MPTVTPTRDNTCGIIVTFHPDESFSEHFEQVAAQFARVIIVDNGSGPTAVALLQKLANRQNATTVISNLTNWGIAAALNQGIIQAKTFQFAWVVTFDQDTYISSKLLEALLEVYEECGGGDVMIGCNYNESHKKKELLKYRDSESNFLERKTLITSGTLTPLDIFDRIGFFREDYFIDSVDHEFSLRARAHGYRMLICCRPLMRHSIGNIVKGQRNIRLLMSYHHPAKRKYYISRNTVFTAICYFSREPAWCIRQGWRMLNDLVSIILLEEEKSRKLRAFLTGIAHGIKGKMGPIEETWPNGTY